MRLVRLAFFVFLTQTDTAQTILYYISLYVMKSKAFFLPAFLSPSDRLYEPQ
jgi:hypothetical protein